MMTVLFGKKKERKVNGLLDGCRFSRLYCLVRSLYLLGLAPEQVLLRTSRTFESRRRTSSSVNWVNVGSRSCAAGRCPLSFRKKERVAALLGWVRDWLKPKGSPPTQPEFPRKAATSPTAPTAEATSSSSVCRSARDDLPLQMNRLDK